MKHEIDVKFYPGWTRKAISFSIDDGKLDTDKKFMDIVEPYGIRGTFNLCSERLARMSPEEAEKMLTSAGRDKSEEILKIIRGY